MKYLVLSFHISKVGAEGISRLSVAQKDWSKTLLPWIQKLPAEDLLYLATCNRVEYIFQGGDLDQLMTEIDQHIPVDTANARFYSQTTSVIQHLLEIALSVDSVVFGENQILGQLKTAYQDNLKHKLCGNKTSILLQLVLQHAKLIRTKNHLSNIHNTVSTVAGKNFLLGQDSELPILLVGAGESNQLLARYLSKRSMRKIIWTNRTNEKAKLAAEKICGDVLNWEDYQNGKIPEVEAVFTTTNAGKFILSEEQLKNSQTRKVFDLSIPANTDSTICEKLGIQYTGMDTIQKILDKEQERYKKLKTAIAKDIQIAVTKINLQLQERSLSPIISESLDVMDGIVANAIDNLPKNLQSLDQNQLDSLKKWTRSLVKKTKHEHISQIKKLKK